MGNEQLSRSSRSTPVEIQQRFRILSAFCGPGAIGRLARFTEENTMTEYICPNCEEPFEVDPKFIDFDENGEAKVTHRDHEITIARPVSQGFGGSDAT